MVRFRLRDLCALVEKRFGVSYQESSMAKLIKKLGFRRISARPQHPKSDRDIQIEYKKIPKWVREAIGDRAAGCLIEIWFAE